MQSKENLCIEIVAATHTTDGDERMKNGQEVLSSILKTTQMGQVGIRCVYRKVTDSALKSALHSQLQEYNEIEKKAEQLAQARCWKVEELAPAVKAMASMISRSRLQIGSANSKVAAMMIQGNTRGMIKGLKNLHRYYEGDSEIKALANRLLDYEQENIKQMQGFV